MVERNLGQEIMARLDRLAEFTEDEGQLTRTYLTPVQRAAGEEIIGWMAEAGMSAGFDPAGNVVGRYEGTEPGLPALMTGSHFDTVRNAGRYDGMLGVVAPISVVKALNEQGRRLPFAIEVVGFADEEGVRFQSTLLGSRAIAGTFDTALLDKQDRDGITMAQAMTSYGLDPAKIGDAARRPDEVLAFVEVHIEQGPVLESEGLAAGIVTGIAGANRFNVRMTGLAGHAGTVPMGLRRDAAAAAAEAVLYVETRCQGIESLVGTVGVLAVPNGATNVIPGEAELSLDIRAGEDEVRRAAVADILAEIEAIAQRRNIRLEIEQTHDAPSAGCASWLMSQFADALAAEGLPPRQLASGAGHDSMAFTELTDMAMLFVRCGNGGISHHPDETMTAEDADISARILMRFIESFVPSARSGA